MKNIIHGMKGGGKGGGGGGGGRTPSEAPNTLQSKATFRVVEALSEGEIGGLINGAKSIYLDDTPLQNSDNSFNFKGISYVETKGTLNQSYLPGFSSVESEVIVGVQVEQASPVIRTISDAQLDAVSVTIRVPALIKQDPSTGDVSGNSVSFKIEYKPNGGSYIVAHNTNITGKTTSPYESQYRVQLTGSAPWDIRVTRITPDNIAVNEQKDLYWSTYTKIIENKLSYPGWSLIGITVDSSLFGSSIPIRSYEIYGRLINVPTNYNPVTRVYTGIWNGTFKEEVSDNPAWVLYDMLINNRYGIGGFIDTTQVDKYGLYEIGKYCDEFVDNGFGGTEPRFTFNGGIFVQDDALKVLQTIASCFRGMLYWGGIGGVITATQDSPQDPVKLFNKANVIGGQFTYSGQDLSSIYTTCAVTWNDPNNRYLPTVEVVESDRVSKSKSIKMLDIVAAGCTSRGQAARLGKWALDEQGDIVTFKVGLADADIRPGMIAIIADEDYTNIRAGGRLLASTASSVTLDASIDISSGDVCTFSVILPSGVLEQRTVTNSTGTHEVLNLSAPLSEIPGPLAPWFVEWTSLKGRQFRILSVKETQTNEYEISALFHDPNKYVRIEEGILLEDIPYTTIPKGVISPPSNITFLEYLYNTGPMVRSGVTISWEASKDPRVVRYELEIKQPGDGSNYELVSVTNGVSYAYEGTYDGIWSFRVRASDSLGNASAWVELVDQTLNINSTPPGFVEDFQITSLVNTSVLSWSPVNSKNLSHYEIRYSSAVTGASWNASIEVIAKVPKDLTSTVVASRSGTFFIKAVTLPTTQYPLGIYSLDAASISTDIDFLSNFNFVEELIEDPSFNGIYDRVQLNTGNLELTQVSPGVFEPEGYYGHHVILDLGEVYTSRVTPNITASGNSLSNLVDSWDNVDLVPNVDGGLDGQWNVETQVSFTKLDPFIPSTNLLTNTKDFSTVWALTGCTVTANNTLSPDGLLTADSAIESTATSQRVLARLGYIVPSGTSFTFQVLVKPTALRQSIAIFLLNGANSRIATYKCDLNTVSNIINAGTATGTSTIEPYGNGWFLLTQTIVFPVAVTTISASIYYGPTGGVGNATYLGNGTSSVALWGASLYQGTTLYNPWGSYGALDVGDINARAFKFRTKLNSFFTTTTPSIETLSVSVDMVDYIQSGQNLPSSNTVDTIVSFSKTFRSTRPSVVITAQSMQTGDYYIVTNITASGFTINFYNSSGTRINRTFDYHAKGYGTVNI